MNVQHSNVDRYPATQRGGSNVTACRQRAMAGCGLRDISVQHKTRRTHSSRQFSERTYGKPSSSARRKRSSCTRTSIMQRDSVVRSHHRRVFSSNAVPTQLTSSLVHFVFRRLLCISTDHANAIILKKVPKNFLNVY